ncbi:MAG: hypothetical protein Fues2KO_34030 [Fuerstiella sp.]
MVRAEFGKPTPLVIVGMPELALLGPAYEPHSHSALSIRVDGLGGKTMWSVIGVFTIDGRAGPSDDHRSKDVTVEGRGSE